MCTHVFCGRAWADQVKKHRIGQGYAMGWYTHTYSMLYVDVCPWSLYGWRPCFRFDFMCVRQTLRCFLPRWIPLLICWSLNSRLGSLFCMLFFYIFSEANDRLEIVSFIVDHWSLVAGSTSYPPPPQSSSSTSKRAPIINLWIAAGRIKVVHHHYH